MSGFAQVVGQPDGPPTLPPFMLADGVAAQAATWAVMMALYHRDVNGGEGQLIDINLIEPLARTIESSTLAYDQLGRIPGRVGNALPASAPRNAYRTADDKWMAISSAVAHHRGARVPGHRPPRPGRGPRLHRPGPASGALRRGRRAGRRLGRAAPARRGRWRSSSAAEIAAAPVYDAAAAAGRRAPARPGARSCPSTTPTSAPCAVQAPLARLSETPGRIDHLGRSLGADNDAVYGDLLGLDAERLDALRAAGVI